MSEQRIRKYILHLCLCIVACAITALTFAAEQADTTSHAAMLGRWEGKLSGAFREQDVSWSFEKDEDGVLKGYMGPSIAGMPRVPMENLTMDEGQLSFTIAAQHAVFEGAITPDGIAGTWQQGGTLPLRMIKKDFAFVLPASVRTELAGRWSMRGEGAQIFVEFVEAGNGTLSGTLSVPTSGIRAAPLVDIFVGNDGLAQFATDNGRRFTGRLANGVLLGEYVRDDSRLRYQRPFRRVGDTRKEFDLALSDAARERLGGRWLYDRYNDAVLEVTLLEDSRTQARMDYRRSGDEAVLELKVEGGTVSWITLGGTTFTGNFEGDNIVGEFRSNSRRPEQATFKREPPPE